MRTMDGNRRIGLFDIEFWSGSELILPRDLILVVWEDQILFEINFFFSKNALSVDKLFFSISIRKYQRNAEKLNCLSLKHPHS